MKQIAEDFILRDDLSGVDLSPLRRAVLPLIPEDGDTETGSGDLNTALKSVREEISEPSPEKRNGEATGMNPKSIVYGEMVK